MTKTIYILLITTIFSCNNTVNKIENDNVDNIVSSESDSNLNFVDFNEKQHLFLDFYESMSPQKFRTVAKKKLESKQLFYLKIKNENENIYSSALLDSSNFSNYDSLSAKNITPNSFEQNLFYPISTSKSTFYASLSPKFDEQKLISLSLYGPAFYPSSEYYEDKIIKTKSIEEYNKNVIMMYSEKYGKPKATTINYGKDHPFSKLAGVDNFKKTDYTFNAFDKTIIISIQCCNVLTTTEIKYLLTSEYNKEKKNKQLEESKRIKEQKKANEKTQEEI